MSDYPRPGMSRYVDAIAAFGMAQRAKAVYCFVIEGKLGTGGCPLVLGPSATDRAEYERCNRELIAMMRRSADLLEKDLERQGFGKGDA